MCGVRVERDRRMIGEFIYYLLTLVGGQLEFSWSKGLYDLLIRDIRLNQILIYLFFFRIKDKT